MGSPERRLNAAGTKLGCQIRSEAFRDGASAAVTALGTAAFSNRMKRRIAEVLGKENNVLRGDAILTSIAAWNGSGTQGGEKVKSSPSWAVWTIVCVAALVLLLVAGCLVARRRKGNSGRSAAGEPAV